MKPKSYTRGNQGKLSCFFNGNKNVPTRKRTATADLTNLHNLFQIALLLNIVKNDTITKNNQHPCTSADNQILQQFSEFETGELIPIKL